MQYACSEYNFSFPFEQCVCVITVVVVIIVIVITPCSLHIHVNLLFTYVEESAYKYAHNKHYIYIHFLKCSVQNISEISLRFLSIQRSYCFNHSMLSIHLVSYKVQDKIQL